MPRAKRLFVPGDVLHITHRCPKKEFLLKFRRDIDRYDSGFLKQGNGMVFVF